MEVAGVVLGALPLVTSALSEYQTGLRKLNRSLKYQQEVKKLLRSAKEQKILFQDNLQKLLNAAVPSSTGIRDVADKYSEELWSGETAECVRSYLGEERHELFEETVEEFEKCLLELANELNHVQRNPKIKMPTMELSTRDIKYTSASFIVASIPRTVWRTQSTPQAEKCSEKLIFVQKADKPALTRADLKTLASKSSEKANPFSKRFNFIIREDTVVQLSQELNGLNLCLDRLLDNSRTLHHYVESTVIADVQTATSLSVLLHQVRQRADRMFRAFHWSWSAGCHAAHEAMLYLDSPILHGQGKLCRHTSSSQFRLLVRDKPTGQPTSCSWHEAIVTVDETDENPTVSPAHGVPTLSTPNTQAATAATTVENLCQDIRRARDEQKSLDMVLYESFVSTDQSAWPACLIHPNETYQVVTLEQLVAKRKRMLPASKVTMALKLAASLLQFKTSQWLSPSWTNTTIQFFHPSNQRVDVEHPLIVQSFHTPGPPNKAERNPRPLFLDLGILLLEIWTLQTYDDWLQGYRDEADYPDDVDAMSRTECALAWFDEASDYMTVRYGKVVKTCLAFELQIERGMPTWDDKDLRLAVCARIIQPLREECGTFPSR